MYWNLEAIIAISENISAPKELEEILQKTALFNDYTIREKTAKVASVLKIESVLNLLKDDDNVYVKKYLK